MGKPHGAPVSCCQMPATTSYVFLFLRRLGRCGPPELVLLLSRSGSRIAGQPMSVHFGIFFSRSIHRAFSEPHTGPLSSCPFLQPAISTLAVAAIVIRRNS
ncbi:hypothetical protein GQ607_011360 [Colletotrichum asianum]|uniref:Uncharacterized protein n=1 Tax=Colletotrichum asianum TaxID=702518 RepID=A0A8H3W8S6_9PEZI|nr:hypothetical protein GQ607_011360 [Colletotrichum asianum]